jgi:hypothetical protein
MTRRRRLRRDTEPRTVETFFPLENARDAQEDLEKALENRDAAFLWAANEGATLGEIGEATGYSSKSQVLSIVERAERGAAHPREGIPRRRSA